jgi:VanZ family protein
MTLLLRPRVRRGCALLWCLAWPGVAALLLMPVSVPAPQYSDLVAHFVLFGTMAATTVTFGRSNGQLALLTLGTIAAATALEAVQGLVPYRSFDPLDALANTFGATVGYALATIVLELVIRPADPALRAQRAGG